MQYENKKVCEECKGKCCKKSGCDYFVSDFDNLTKESITKLLETGNVSIVGSLNFDILKDGKKICYPFLYLRARNIDRGVVDIFSMKKQCSMLTDTGCYYSIDKRPGGGVNLIPYNINDCRPLLNPVDEIGKWEPYQNLLSKMVKKFSNMSVDANMSKDVEEVFYSIITENFDGVAKAEIFDIMTCINDLAECFPEELKRARSRSKNIKVLLKN